MRKLKVFFITTLFGGLVVVLPAATFAYAMVWFFKLLTSAIQPLTDFVMRQYGLLEIVADAVVITGMVLACFFLGLFVATSVGRFFKELFERTLHAFPGYSVIHELYSQVFGGQKSPFTKVAFVELFPDVLVTAFVTAEVEGCEWMTIYAPTAPNPTSGITYVVKRYKVQMLDVEPSRVMRIIISCGLGSEFLLKFLTKDALPKEV